MQRISFALATIAFTCLVTDPAFAQGYGVRAGANVNPDQMSVGAQYEAGPLVETVWLQPNIDVGFGNGATLFAVNLDAAYRHAMSRRSPWSAFFGGGPAINFYRFAAYSQRELGLNAVLGLRHRGGVFTEARIGFLESPQFRLGVGYTFDSNRRGSNRPTPRR